MKSAKKLVFCLFFFCCLFLISCQSNYSLAKKNVAEMTFNTFANQDDLFRITFHSGEREEDYITDGKAQKRIPFGVLTVFKLNSKIKENIISFKLNINETIFENQFEANPFDNSFVFDAGVFCNFDSKINVTIFYKGDQRQYQLKNALEIDDLTSNEALKIACKHLKFAIKKLTKYNKLNGEFYVCHVFTTSNPVRKPLWYITLVGQNNQSFGIVINASTRQVLAKKL